MNSNLRTNGILTVVAALLCCLAMSVSVSAQGTETVLHAFIGGSDGAYPYTGVVTDPSGNLFAATSEQGNMLCHPYAGCGTLLELSPNGSGGWTQKSLIFPGGVSGGFPTGIAVDAAGDLYISEFDHGVHKGGQVVELSPNGHGGWIKSLVHAFDGTDGSGPYGMTLDSAGDLYGMTAYSAKGHVGLVYKLSRNGSGQWIDHTLYTFTGNADGNLPLYATVALDPAGNIYGTTYGGGVTTCGFVSGCGVVFELSNSGGGVNETVLHTFTGTPDGDGPSGNLLVDAAGNIYGTALFGGNNNSFGCGTVFELKAVSGGGWQYNTLYTFQDNGDGCNPNGLAWDAAGNIVGATAFSIYKLLPNGSGGWNFAPTYSFTAKIDGYNDFGTIVVDSSGNIYGTMLDGGDPSCRGGCGVVYEVTP